MKLLMFSVYDTATQAYMRPFYAQTQKLAERMFDDLVMDQNQEVFRHPEDYSLFQVGEFDDSTGGIVSINPKGIVRAHEAKARIQAELSAEDAQESIRWLNEPGGQATPDKKQA